MKRLLWISLIGCALTLGLYLCSRREPVVTVRLGSEWFTSSEKPLIVFVHGLGGDPYDTWGKDGRSFMELIREDPAFGDFHVVSVSYPTSILKRDASLPQLATSFAAWLDKNFTKNTEIVIIAHSLGGIIARQGLVQSGFKDRNDQLVTLITLASPFDGSQLPDFGRILDAFKMSSRQMSALSVGSDTLQLCESNWSDLVKHHGRRIRQFAASEGKSIKGVTVVSEESATRNISCDECKFRSELDDHLSIAKPKTLDAGIGKQVRNWILNRVYKTGNYSVEYDLHIPASGSLVIEAGTNITFKNATVTINGRVDARGTTAAPIKFEFSSEGNGDAGVLLRGKSVAGSSFQSCWFQKGRGVRMRKPGPETIRKVDRNDAWSENEVPVTSAGQRYGGGVILIGASEVTFKECTFVDNAAFQGGAMALLGSSKIDLRACRFEKNASGYGGGAIFSQGSQFVVGVGSHFEGNCSGQMVELYKNDSNSKNACGGAIYVGYGSRCTIEDTSFTGNKASHAGGAVYIRDTHAAPVAPQDNQLSGLKFRENESTDNGTALCIEANSKGTVTNLTFEDNAAGPNLEKPLLSFVDDSVSGFLVNGPVWRRNGLDYTEEYRSR